MDVRLRRPIRGKLLILFAAFQLQGCSSGFTEVSASPKSGDYQRLGNVSGEACGSMLLGGYSFIPVGQNERLGKAYKAALMNNSEASSLVDVTVDEQWYWWLLGTTRCTTVSGVAVK